MKKLTYLLVLFSSLGEELTSSPSQKARQEEGRTEWERKQPPRASTWPMWGQALPMQAAPTQRDAQTQTQRSGNQEDTDGRQQSNLGAFRQRERTPQQEYAPMRSVTARNPGQEPSELNILLAKIKSAGGLGNEIQLKLKTQQEIEQRAQNKTIIQLEVNRSTTHHKKYFFNELSVENKDGTINKCKSNNLYDKKVTDQLSKETLGQGQEWEIQRPLSNWQQKWEQGKVLFIVKYGDQRYILVPSNRGENRDIEAINEDKWHASWRQKLNTGLDVLNKAAIGAATGYYIVQKLREITKETKPTEQTPRKQEQDTPEQEKTDHETTAEKQTTRKQHTQNRIHEIANRGLQHPIKEQQVYAAITGPSGWTEYDNPRNNYGMLNQARYTWGARKVTATDKNKAQEAARTCAVINKATEITKGITKLIATKDMNKFFHNLQKVLHGTSPTNSESKKYYGEATRDKETGEVCQLTWQTYEQLEQSFKEMRRWPCQGYDTTVITKTSNTKQKAQEARQAIEQFFKTPKGKQGMVAAMTRIESLTKETGINKTPDKQMDTTERIDDSTLEKGIQAIACLLALRTIEKLIHDIQFGKIILVNEKYHRQ
jgi:hypothetical protein